MRRVLAWGLCVVTVAWAAEILEAAHVVEVRAASHRAGTAAEAGPWSALRWQAARAAYAIGSVICHQRPERSFHTGATQWPVCARCTGLYLAAPFGAIALLLARRGRAGAGGDSEGASPAAGARASASTAAGADAAHAAAAGGATADPIRAWRTALVLAALPTVLSLAFEWLGGPTSGLSRLVTALPLGATVVALAGAAILGLDPNGISATGLSATDVDRSASAPLWRRLAPARLANRSRPRAGGHRATRDDRRPD